MKQFVSKLPHIQAEKASLGSRMFIPFITNKFNYFKLHFRCEKDLCYLGFLCSYVLFLISISVIFRPLDRFHLPVVIVELLVTESFLKDTAIAELIKEETDTDEFRASLVATQGKDNTSKVVVFESQTSGQGEVSS